MRSMISIILFLTTVSLFAQESGANVENKDYQVSKSQESKAIEETEKILDGRIAALNDRLKNHTKLFKMKVQVLPAKTVLFKGVATEDGDCKQSADQESGDNNCLKLEIYDFIGADEGQAHLSKGSRKKYIIMFYDGKNSSEKPEKEQPRNVTKIKSRIDVNNLAIKDRKISEVIDSSPHQKDNHNEKVSVFFQQDGFPSYNAPENPSNRGYGKYTMNNVENTRTNPTRNTFKKNFYIKHLDKFDKMFTAIFDYNVDFAAKKYKKSNQILINSLNY